ncbi:hypothetical protein WL68_16005 [Burkholderia cepacia]|nr:hypothetical protein WL68_16005 [Burkholderia cepacia]KWD80699.1 hypothetical protein WL69_18445 [Burkholderia cepacia]
MDQRARVSNGGERRATAAGRRQSRRVLSTDNREPERRATADERLAATISSAGAGADTGAAD